MINMTTPGYYRLVWLLRKKPLTLRQLFVRALKYIPTFKPAICYTGYKGYETYGTNIRQRCRALYRFGLIKKVKRLKVRKLGPRTWVFGITDKGKQWLDIQHDTYPLHKKRT